jgi:hypothetical protein
MTYFDNFLRPPAKIDTPYDEAIAGPLWAYEGDYENRSLPFASDAEMSELSRVPERSLRTLQTSVVIDCTFAPMRRGGHRRVWHFPESVAARVADCYVRATKSSYQDQAGLMNHAGLFAKMLFVRYVVLQTIGAAENVDLIKYFDAEIIIAANHCIVARVSKKLLEGSPNIIREYEVRDGLCPLAIIQEGKALGLLPGKHDKRREYAIDFLKKSHFRTVIDVGLICKELEEHARKMRQPEADQRLTAQVAEA